MSVNNVLLSGRISPAALPTWSGVVTLAAGTATVTIPFLPANVIVLLQYVTTGAAPEAVGASAVANAGLVNASFNILSASNTDVSQVRYVVLQLA
jgi:hypothetical protein